MHYRNRSSRLLLWRALANLACASSAALLAGPAWAGNWGDDWQTMFWGSALPVPTLPTAGFVLLGVVVSAVGVRLLRRQSR